MNEMSLLICREDYDDCEDYKEDFICRVMNQFSQWGVNVDYILTMMEKCADDSERLDIIESCLNKLCEFQIEPETFLWRIASDDMKALVQDASIAVECKDLLCEFDEIRYDSSPLMYESEWAA